MVVMVVDGEGARRGMGILRLGRRGGPMDGFVGGLGMVGGMGGKVD